MSEKDQFEEWSRLDCDSAQSDGQTTLDPKDALSGLEDLRGQLEAELGEQLSSLDDLQRDMAKIGSPDALGETVMNVVWEQFINQVGVVAGEEFIRENRNLRLDLRKSAHTQTTDNFARGKIATHNDRIDYQRRYDEWQSNFQHDAAGNVVTHGTRTGRQEATLEKGARAPFDAGRPAGSRERHTDMDHTVSAAQIIRDAAANAHLSKEEQIDFANSDVNLREMNSQHNRSKKDLATPDWLDNANSNGQTPREIFSDPLSDDYMSAELEQQYREDHKVANEAYAELKEEGEARSEATGEQSQQAEALRFGGKALRSVLMGLLASLVKEIVAKLVEWYRKGERKLATFIESVRQALRSFVANLKKHLITAGDTLGTTILTAILGPIIGTIKKAWIFLKEGYKSVRAAIRFLRDPANRSMPLSVKLLEVGKIVIAGLTVGGALVLGEAIEKGLSIIPILAFPIPLLGSLASILGIFLGAVVSGIVGAFALHKIDALLATRMRRENSEQQVATRNGIIGTQGRLIAVGVAHMGATRDAAARNVAERHAEAAHTFQSIVAQMSENATTANDLHDKSASANAEIDDLLNDM